MSKLKYDIFDCASILIPINQARGCLPACSRRHRRLTRVSLLQRLHWLLAEVRIDVETGQVRVSVRDPGRGMGWAPQLDAVVTTSPSSAPPWCVAPAAAAPLARRRARRRRPRC